MLIKISSDLKKLEVYGSGANLSNILGKDRQNGKRVFNSDESKKLYVCTFKNPVLLTDNFRISKLKPSLRDTIFSLYSSRPRTVEYDGVSVIDRGYPQSVWSPSIDTILFAKAINKLFKHKRYMKKAVEIGTGSGFLSKYILMKNKNLKSVLINDLNPYAVQCAKENIKDKRAKFFIGDGLKKIKGNKFDLIICNPPYIPRHGSIDDNPYEGVGLLYNLVHNGSDFLEKNGLIITNVSSLCWDIIFKNKPKMKVTILEKMKVPLKVNNVLNNESWMKYLLKNGLKKEYHDGYEYWHTLNIIALHK